MLPCVINHRRRKLCWEHYNLNLVPRFSPFFLLWSLDPGRQRRESLRTRLRASVTHSPDRFCAWRGCDKKNWDALLRAKRNKNNTPDSGKGSDRRLNANSTKAQIQNNANLFGWSNSEKNEYKSVSVYVFYVIIVLPNGHHFFIF